MDNTNEEIEEINETSIAIIGMSGRFPGAKNITELWQNLKNGVESITFFSDQELIESGIDPTLLKNSNYIKAKGALDNVTDFDAAFFDMSPKETEIMDPQQRLFLECAWEALENAGYDPKTYSGSIGVYGGITGSDTYLSQNLHTNRELRETIGDFQISLNNNHDFLCTHVSYKFDLSGPSVTVQTACSTSLVAVVMGYQSLLDYQCDMVLAGGVAITLPQKTGYLYQEGMIMSPDGHCRAFDANAKGTVEGNGLGIVVLKRLTDALADGDTIHAIIKGAALNNDGASKVGYSAPSMDAQTRLIAEALTLAQVSPQTISYVEAHGTATSIGDPIEIGALTQAFQAQTDQKGYCAIGSVKTNIGHLDTAAGVTGLIKTTLALEHQLLPPSLHFKKPNPKLDLANSPFYINTALSKWETNGFPRRACVNSFGIGGTNAHVVLEEAPTKSESPISQRPWQLLLLSAKTDTALEAVTTQLIEHFKQHSTLPIADVAYTYQVGRSPFSHRRMLVCQTLEDALQVFETQDAKRVLTQTITSKQEPSVVLMFSGQGTQYVNMGLELYQTEPVFREQVDYCAEWLKPHLGLDLRTLLYPHEKSQSIEAAAEQLKQTAITQPALFVIEYALAQLWQSWGIQPTAMIGHSIGEYVAACLAGVFSLEDALTLVAARGRLIQSVPAGAMLAVPLPESDIQPFLNQNLDLATINVPSQSVVSGTFEAVEQLLTQLAEQGIEGQRLHTSHAFHSTMMEPVLPSFLEQVQKIILKKPLIPFISNVTGTWIQENEATDPHYWVKHLRQTVRFAAGLEQILQESATLLLEVGPGRTLSTFAKRHPKKKSDQFVLTSLHHPKEEQSDSAFLLNTLGQLWLAGVMINWANFYGYEQRYRLPLPTYPFERQRYWIEPVTQAETVKPSTDLLKKKPDMADWFYVPSWKRTALPPIHQVDTAKEPFCWLIFIDDCGLGTQLVTRLQQQGQDLITIKVGEQFSNDRPGYIFNPGQPEDYEKLLQDLTAQNKKPKVILHLWTVTSNDNRESSLEVLDQFQDLSFYSLLFLAQALGKQNSTDNLTIYVVSNHLQTVIGDEWLCPEKATLLGPCRVIPVEYPNITCRSIDIVLPDSNPSVEKILVEQLLAELNSTQSDSIIAYRGKHRWVSTFEPVRLEENHETFRLRKNGVYFITGGLGGMGLTLAEHLAKTVQAKLILTTRSEFPIPSQWTSWLATHSEQDRLSRQIKQLQAIEVLGGEVLILTADVTNVEQMQTAITQSLKHFGHIHGVIHTAGVPSNGVIQQKTPEMVKNVLAPKVKGTRVLETIFKDIHLDFWVLCSSLDSILGGFGEVDYCSANAFLDTFAHFNHSKNGKLTFCINWDAWQEVGMAANAKHKEWQEKSLKQAILPQEGTNVFSRILGTTFPQILVSTHDLKFQLEQGHVFAIPHFQVTPTDDSDINKVLHSRPALKNTYFTPRNKLEQVIIKVWENFFNIEGIGIFDNFFELGGDSLMAVQLVSELRRITQLELSVHSLLDKTTPAALAEAMQPKPINEHQTSLPALPPSLVKVQTGNSLIPAIFLVHPIGGHVYIYRDLAHYLGNEQPVYAFQAQGVDGEMQPLTQIEVMAAHYIKALQVIQPEGPYILGGLSFGGIVAFEMAQQFHALGEKITLLFMIDTPGPEISVEETYFNEVNFEVLKANKQAMNNYAPKIYPGKILFFRALEPSTFMPKNPERSWINLASEGMDIYEISGDHTSMNFPPHVEEMANLLKKYL